MRRFHCPGCGHLVFFESDGCEACGRALAYDPGTGTFVEVAGEVRLCDNAVHGVCNWVAQPKVSSEPIGVDTRHFCAACAHNATIPDLTQTGALAVWRPLENAKHRLVYGLMRAGVPLGREGDPHPLRFHFAAGATTGHAQGNITIALREADPVELSRQQQAMGERYRSPLGHLCHEAGHYIFELLSDNANWLTEFRKLFGDESSDYGIALTTHYENGPQADWIDHYISAYASAHPLEDWAECCAQVLHILDVLETSVAYDLSSHYSTGAPNQPVAEIRVDFDPYSEQDWQTVMTNWIGLTIPLNELSRAMGHGDYNPFVISPAVSQKLEFVLQSLQDWMPKFGAWTEGENNLREQSEVGLQHPNPTVDVAS